MIFMLRLIAETEQWTKIKSVWGSLQIAAVPVEPEKKSEKCFQPFFIYGPI